MEPGAGDVVLDVGVDSVQGCPEFGWGLGLVGGEQQPQEPVVQLGVEDRGGGRRGSGSRPAAVAMPSPDMRGRNAGQKRTLTVPSAAYLISTDGPPGTPGRSPSLPLVRR